MEVIFDDTVVSMLVDGVYYPIFCATGMSLNISQDTVLATTVDSARVPRLRGLYNWEISVSGLTKVANDGQISWFYLAQQSIRGVEQTIKFDAYDKDGNIQTISGQMIIPALGFASSAGNFATADVTFVGAGNLSMEIVPPPVPPDCMIEDTLYINTTEGEFSLDFSELEVDGAEILWVVRTTDTHYPTAFSPGNLQYRWVPGTSTVEFDPLNPFNPGEFVSVGYKVTA